jgi:hypothetical protein
MGNMCTKRQSFIALPQEVTEFVERDDTAKLANASPFLEYVEKHTDKYTCNIIRQNIN